MSANTNFVYVNDGQPWCAHTDRCIHKHTKTDWTLPISVRSNALGWWHTELVSSWDWLRQGHMFVDKGWSGRDADLLQRVQRSWLTPCLCSGGNITGHLINQQSPVMRDCMIPTGAVNKNIRLHLNNSVCSLISVQNVHLLENFTTVEVVKYWVLKIQSNKKKKIPLDSIEFLDAKNSPTGRKFSCINYFDKDFSILLVLERFVSWTGWETSWLTCQNMKWSRLWSDPHYHL